MPKGPADRKESPIFLLLLFSAQWSVCRRTHKKQDDYISPAPSHTTEKTQRRHRANTRDPPAAPAQPHQIIILIKWLYLTWWFADFRAASGWSLLPLNTRGCLFSLFFKLKWANELQELWIHVIWRIINSCCHTKHFYYYLNVHL